MRFAIKNMSKTLVELEHSLEEGIYRDAFTLSNVYRELFRLCEEATEPNAKGGIGIKAENKNTLLLQESCLGKLCELMRKKVEEELEKGRFVEVETILKTLRSLIYRKSELKKFLERYTTSHETNLSGLYDAL